jgi:EAL domain-containing protein (putative c-di-GMP-specific phosphodiesterase class I)
MAHKLDIEVIAEGVESADQEKLLKGFGCDYAQGYLYSRPVGAKEFETLIGQRATGT